jgi:hypothetical protein
MTRRSLVGPAAVLASLAGVVMGLSLAFMSPEVAADRWSYPQTPTHFTWMQIGFVIQHIPCILALAAATCAVGRSRTGRIGWYVGIAGMALLTINEGLAITARDQASDSPLASIIGSLYGVGTLMIAIGLMVGGVAAIRARIWSKAEGFLMFALGAWLLVPTLPVLIIWPNEPSRIVLSLWVMGFGALGIVITRRATSASWRRGHDDGTVRSA